MAKMKKNTDLGVEAEVVEKMEFEVWHSMRAPLIPKQHRMEILRADFNGQGLGPSESLQAFDDALGVYGVKLKLDV